jgi:hypothetical protein
MLCKQLLFSIIWGLTMRKSMPVPVQIRCNHWRSNYIFDLRLVTSTDAELVHTEGQLCEEWSYRWRLMLVISKASHRPWEWLKAFNSGLPYKGCVLADGFFSAGVAVWQEGLSVEWGCHFQDWWDLTRHLFKGLGWAWGRSAGSWSSDVLPNDQVLWSRDNSNSQTPSR